MKIKLFPVLAAAGLSVLAPVMTSCLDDDVTEITYRSETSITSFSLGTLHITVNGKDKEGNDSAYVDTLSMGNYPFTINQATREIENKDSLPVGTDISRVVAKIGADTDYIVYGKISKEGGEPKDTLWTEADSLNFAIAPDHTLKFKVTSYSGMTGVPYKIKINVHKVVPDSLQWSGETMGSAFVSGSLSKQKAVCLNNRIYVFGVADGVPVAEYAAITGGNPGKWSAITLPEGTDTYSATSWRGDVYFLADGKLYNLSAPQTPVTGLGDLPSGLNQLIAGAGDILYARTAEGKFATYDGSKAGDKRWTVEGGLIPQFPGKGEKLATANLPVSYNKELTRTVTMGYNGQEKKSSGFMASRLSNDGSWTAYNYEQIDTFKCPNIVDPTMIYYNKKLYAFGGSIDTDDYKYPSPFSVFFCSTDNGLTWKPVTRYMAFPEDKSFETLYKKGKAGENCYSCAVDPDNFIWIIWHDGKMSRGRINHLGFPGKWD